MKQKKDYELQHTCAVFNLHLETPERRYLNTTRVNISGRIFFDNRNGTLHLQRKVPGGIELFKSTSYALCIVSEMCNGYFHTATVCVTFVYIIQD